MADSILRLKVESQEYDNKLKRAAEGIQRLASKIHDSQGEFVGLENEQKEFIKNLQYMNTVSQTATGKVKELETAYKGLQTMYNGFNAFEKNSEEGKILAEQLSILKEKTLQARKEMEDANKSLSSTGGFLDQLTSKFTVNIDALKLFDIGMKAAGAALDVAKDAFFASESTVDEWGRVMDSNKSLYEGFLTALNTGDISGYLSRIDTIVKAAREAYNELDRLGTMKTIQGPQMSAQQTENERMRMMIQTGRYIAPVDGRRASMRNGQVLTPEQIKRIEQQLQSGMQKIVTLVSNEVHQTGRAIDAVYNRQSQELGMSLKEFRKGTSTMAEFDKRMEGYQKYLDWDKNARTKFAKQGGQGRVDFDKSNPFFDFKKWGVFRVDGERYNDLVKLIQQRDQQAGQAYSMQSQAYRTMNRAEGLTLRQIMKGVTTGGGGTTTKGGGDIKEEKDEFEEIIGLIPQAEEAVKSLQQQIRLSEDVDELKFLNEELRHAQENLKELQSIGDTITPAVSDTRGLIERRRDNYVAGLAAQGEQYNDNILNSVLGIQHRYGLSDINMSSIQNAMENGGKVSDEELRDILRQLNEKLSGTGMSVSADGNGNISDERSIDKLIKDINKGNELYSKAVGGISNIVGGMQQLGVEIPEGLSQLLNALNGISTILTGISSILSFISVVTSAKPFALGGVVKAAGGVVAGRNFSGDAVPALLSSGEVVLNRAEVSTLASTLENGNRSEPVDRQPYVTGEYIWLGVNNYLRGSGKGSIVTTKR